MMVIEAAAHHFCSQMQLFLLAGPLKSCRSSLGFYSHLGDVLSRVFMLKFPSAKVKARTGGSVFHPFSSSRKEAEEL